MSENPAQFSEFAARLADAARGETMPRWRTAGAARNKAESGSFDPVTEADVGAERAMRKVIEEQFPDHGIAGEETSRREAQSRWCWSLDPIDGTRSFICGMPTWVTLIALLDEGAPVLGLIDAPRLDERYIGIGSTAIVRDRDGEHPLSVSGCTRLSDARLTLTDPAMFQGAEADAFLQVLERAKTVRYGHDGYGYARLAAGSIDLVVESCLQPYDYNAVIPVIRGAGGAVSNWSGGGDMRAGQIVAAASQQLLEEALVHLRPAAKS